MKTRTLVAVATGSALLCLAPSLVHAQASDPEPPAKAVTITPTVDINSNYMWRGIRLSDNWVIQPGVTVESHGASLNVWSNWDLNEYPYGSGNGGGRLNEVDITGTYSHGVGKATLSGGFIYYALRDYPDTTEFFATVAFEAPLAPSLSGYWDVDQGKGGFLMLTLGQDVQLAPNVPLKLGGYLSYDIHHKVMGVLDSGEAFNGFYNAEVSAAIPVPVNARLSLTPRAAYTFPLTGDSKIGLRSASYKATNSRFYVGINATAKW